MSMLVRRLSKLISVTSAAAIAIGTCLPASLAFADPTNIANQSTVGTTNIVLVTDDAEYGGTDDPNNPEQGTSGLGSNIAFTAPTELDFVVKASGEMLCPSATATAIENKSAYGVHVSGLQIENATGWNFVADAALAPSTTTNAVSMNVGPAAYTTEKLSFATCLTKQDVNDDTKWGMSAKDTPHADQLNLLLDGKAANIVNAPTSAFAEFGYMHWYLTAGGEGTRYVDPAEVHAITKTTVNETHGSYVLSTTTNAEDALSTLEYTDGDPLYVIATPDTGYAVYSVTVTSGGESVSVTTPINGSRNLAGFIMPDGDVTVTVNFQPIYDITAAATTHGTYKVSSDEAGENTIDQAFMNDTVYVVANPRTGYEDVTFTIETVGGTAITPTAVGESGNVVSFTMPADGVNVGVAFNERALSDYSLGELQSISADIRTNGSSSTYWDKYLAYAQTGQRINLILGDEDHTESYATLVDVKDGRGLVFQLKSLGKYPMDSDGDGVGGWPESTLRASLNSGDLYTTYLQHMTMNGSEVDPVAVTVYSRLAGSEDSSVSSTDKYWIMGSVEAEAKAYFMSYENASQFAYYATAFGDGTDSDKIYEASVQVTGSTGRTWLRSQYTFPYFDTIEVPGTLVAGWTGAPSSNNVTAPCFCL